MVYYGTGISRGVAAGPIYCYEPFVPAPPCPAHGGSVEEQRALYEAAKQTAHAELSRMCARLEANKAAIFEAHMDILDDSLTMASSLQEQNLGEMDALADAIAASVNQ